MTKYICSRCNYNTDHKHKFISHLRRKFKCPIENENINTEEIYKKYFKNEEKEVSQDVAKYSQNIAKMLPKYSQNIAKQVAKNKKLTKVFKCKYCNKSFSHSSSKYKHEKNRCKKKKDKDNEEEKIKKKLIKEMKKEGRLIDPPEEQFV